jgi:lipoprotein-anchoring transpeptidase ErfK/SrfK
MRSAAIRKRHADGVGGCVTSTRGRGRGVGTVCAAATSASPTSAMRAPLYFTSLKPPLALTVPAAQCKAVVRKLQRARRTGVRPGTGTSLFALGYMRIVLISLLAPVWLSLQTMDACSLDLQTINRAEPSKAAASKGRGINPALVRAQIMLDRAGFSPGEIDGRDGDNFRKATSEFAAHRGMKYGRQLTPELWAALVETTDQPAIVEYAITKEDASGPFLERVPAKMEDMQGLRRLGYGSLVEALAEKFHMSESLLKALNPNKTFETGQTIVVANVASQVGDVKVAHIEIDKSERVLRAFKRDGELVGVFPATVGSAEKPAPSGSFKVTKVAQDPTYRYNPAYAFKGVRATKPFIINPGPNNPVGVVWIALSIPSYGIHGTPNPSQVSKTQSHGCVRLTNWDAKKLAKMVDRNTTVDFVGNESNRSVDTKRTSKQRR